MTDFANVRDRQSACSGLIEGLARVDPQAALDAAVSETKAGERDRLIGKIATIAAANRGSGIIADLLSRIEDPTLRRNALWLSIAEICDSAAADPFALLEQQMESDPGMTFAKAPSEALAALAERDGARAMEFVLRLGSAEERDSVLLKVLSPWRAEDPRAALDWLAKQPPESLPAAGNFWVGTLSGLSYRVPEEFERWVTGLPLGKLRSQAGEMLAIAYAGQGKPAEAMRVFQELAREDVALPDTQALGKCIAGTDPQRAATWVARLPNTPAQYRAVQGVATTWTQRDPGAAAAWVESLPAGATRDAATAALTRTIALVDPVTATEWVARISDSKFRSQAAENVFRIWNRDDPASARNWLETLDGLSQRSRERVLRDYR
jgi:hypothetical protein